MKILFSIVALLVLVACASKPTVNIKLLSIERKSANFARISFESDSEIGHLGNVMVICPLESVVEIKNTRKYSYFINGHLNDYKPTSPPWKYIAHAYIDRNEENTQII